jgi:regulator of replication initiation timing
MFPHHLVHSRRSNTPTQVNRLTRELSALRAQHSASVASNTSQNSSNQALDPGLSHPTPTRQHRSSSNASNRSLSTPSVSSSHVNIHHPQPTAPLAGVSQASFDRAAAAAGSTTANPSISRNPSFRSTSGHSTPALAPASAASLSHRPSLSQATSQVSTAGSFALGSVSPYTSTSSFAEIASSRAELDLVKQENEALRQRVKALERALRGRRNSVTSDASVNTNNTHPRVEAPVARPSVSAWAANMAGMTSVAGPRERSESQSTTTSSRRPEGLEREDSIRVGESAANVGLGLK